MTPAIDGALRWPSCADGAYYEDTDFSGIVYRANCLRFMGCGTVLDPVRLPAAHPCRRLLTSHAFKHLARSSPAAIRRSSDCSVTARKLGREICIK